MTEAQKKVLDECHKNLGEHFEAFVIVTVDSRDDGTADIRSCHGGGFHAALGLLADCCAILPMNDSDKLLVLCAIRQVELQRVATWMLGKILDDLENLRSALAGIVAEADVTGAARADHRKSRLRKLLEETEEQIARVFAEIRKRTLDDLDEVQDVQIQDEKKNWALLFSLAFIGGGDTTVRQTLAFGAPIADSIAVAEDDLARRVSALVTQSVANGEPTPVAIEKINGAAESGVPAVTRPTQAAVEKIARTSVAAIAAKAAEEVEPPARAPALHWMHISILDARTSIPCRQRAFKRWDSERNPIGHNLSFQTPPIYPPEHPCRSWLQRYFEDDGPPTARSLRDLMAAALTPEQQSRVFGSKQLALWRKGQLTDAQLLRQESRPLSVDELRKITDEKGAKQTEFPYL